MVCAKKRNAKEAHSNALYSGAEITIKLIKKWRIDECKVGSGMSGRKESRKPESAALLLAK